MENSPFIDFQKKKVVVTGASSGLGQAISIELSRQGASLVLIGRDKKRLNDTTKLLIPGDHQMIILDLNDLPSISPAITDFSKNNGRIFGLCHSAGIAETLPLNLFNSNAFHSMLDINVTSGIELCKTIGRRTIIEENGGAFLFISSVDALIGKPGQLAYSATKGAINSAIRSLAIELARKKIRVNALSPGIVRTPMTVKAFRRLTKEQVKKLEASFPLGFGQPEDVARAAVFLLAPQNSWITGTNLIVDGGYISS